MALMTRDQIQNMVVETISGTFNYPKQDITLDTTAEDIDGWDSLSHTILMVRLQNQLGALIPEKIATGSATVGELIDNLYQLLGG